ncbi:glycosyltransferase family 4 protein [Pseudoalteromonas sp. T1lg122]|uniref:glycosyltransferase family 4 protein n=1 Tax=Pseudoalteromonas sp. T1lg122 TaxID=2077094 RepID=UPI000CF6B155|nr:glycosyltransferase family 1 protein [Pseudoalteromonas sp. T1lg122]
MKVCIDLTFWRCNKAGGIQTVLLNYLYYFDELNATYSVILYEEELKYLTSNYKFENLKFLNLGKRPNLFIRYANELFLLPKKLLKKNDVILTFNYFCFLSIFFKVRSIIMVHDMNHIDVPETLGRFKAFVRGLLVGNAIRSSELTLTVSKFSEERLKSHYQINKTLVLYNSINERILSKKDISGHKYEDYFLFVGSTHPHKNVDIIIDYLASDGADMNLVIVGQKKKAHDRLLNKVRENNLNSKVHFTGYLPDEELISLYKQAEALIFPSKYEGFGIPPIEAMAMGCPCICSNAAAIPEVCGEAALYFNPGSVAELSDAIHRLKKEEGLREKIINKGFDRVNLFSWKKSAHELYNALEELK